MIDINKVNLEKLAPELCTLQDKWVAISNENRIVASGYTYGEAMNQVKRPDDVILLKVPPVEYSLAP